MKSICKIRPEQAAYLIELDAKAVRAQTLRDTAISAALAGLVVADAVVEKIDPDGTVHLIVPDVVSPDIGSQEG